MGYEITKDLIPGLPKEPYRNGLGAYEGVVGHSTATLEASAERESEYFKNQWKDPEGRRAFVHYFVDWDSIVQNAETAYKAAGAGKVANQRFVHVELCETKDHSKFLESYKRYVWLLAKILKEKNLGVKSGGTLVSHAWVTQNLGGTDHLDPIEYLKSHGVSWAQLVADVTAAYNATTKSGWVQESGKWYFYKNGVAVKNAWAQDSKKLWFYLDETGAMAVNKWIRYKEKWYFVNEKGEMLANGKHLVNGKPYFFQADGAIIITDPKGAIING